jgi:hypothetical protein
MRSRIVLLTAIFVSLGIIYAIFNAEKKQINANEQPTEQNQVCVKLVYDKPIEGYEVTADWQPFEVKDCETGYITINFRDISTGKEFQYVNREKFSSYHTDLITSAEDFDCYKDGEVYHIEYVTKPSPFEESPIDYYLPFQFYDIDFDGEKELLINDYYQGQQGNYYDVFEITDAGLQAKSYPPFNGVDNMMKLDSQNKIITFYTHDGSYYSCSLYYRKVAASTKQTIVIPSNFDERLKLELADFVNDIPSDFHITKAEISLGDDDYQLIVKNGKWKISKHTKSSIKA